MRVLGWHCFVASDMEQYLRREVCRRLDCGWKLWNWVDLNWISEPGGEKMGKVAICVFGAIPEKLGSPQTVIFSHSLMYFFFFFVVLIKKLGPIIFRRT